MTEAMNTLQTTPDEKRFINTSSVASNLEETKRMYLQHIQLKNYTNHTIRQQEQILRNFLSFVQSQGVRDIKGIDLQTLESYKLYLSAQSLTSTTIHGRLITVRQFFRYLTKKEIIYSNPCDEMIMPKEKRTLPQGILTRKEMIRLLKTPDIRTDLGYRDRTIMELFYSTGIRAGELTRLKISDINLEKKILRITLGKGQKDRFLPVNTPTARFLSRYLEKIRPRLQEIPRPSGNHWESRSKTGGDVLFLSIYGGAITPSWLDQIIKKYLKEAGITKAVQPCHCFRHSVATHLLESGMDVRYVQAFLGHENIQTTQRYTHIAREQLKQLLDKYHPREINKIKVEHYDGKNG